MKPLSESGKLVVKCCGAVGGFGTAFAVYLLKIERGTGAIYVISLTVAGMAVGTLIANYLKMYDDRFS